MNLLGVLQETRPVFLLQLLLAQHQLDLAVSVVDLAVLGINLAEQVQRDVVCYTLARGAGERDIGGGEVDARLILGDIGGLQAHVEVVTLGLIGGGALGPSHCKNERMPGQLFVTNGCSMIEIRCAGSAGWNEVISVVMQNVQVRLFEAEAGKLSCHLPSGVTVDMVLGSKRGFQDNN